MFLVACVRPHTGELFSCLMRARESEQLLEIKTQKQRSAPNGAAAAQGAAGAGDIIIGSL